LIEVALTFGFLSWLVGILRMKTKQFTLLSLSRMPFFCPLFLCVCIGLWFYLCGWKSAHHFWFLWLMAIVVCDMIWSWWLSIGRVEIHSNVSMLGTLQGAY